MLTPSSFNRLSIPILSESPMWSFFLVFSLIKCFFSNENAGGQNLWRVWFILLMKHPVIDSGLLPTRLLLRLFAFSPRFVLPLMIFCLFRVLHLIFICFYSIYFLFFYLCSLSLKFPCFAGVCDQWRGSSIYLNWISRHWSQPPCHTAMFARSKDSSRFLISS